MQTKINGDLKLEYEPELHDQGQNNDHDTELMI